VCVRHVTIPIHANKYNHTTTAMQSAFNMRGIA
jgi:hypothetical protein